MPFYNIKCFEKLSVTVFFFFLKKDIVVRRKSKVRKVGDIGLV